MASVDEGNRDVGGGRHARDVEMEMRRGCPILAWNAVHQINLVSPNLQILGSGFIPSITTAGPVTCKGTSTSTPMAIQFPTNTTINLRTINKLLRKRSYIDCERNGLVVLSGGEGPPSAVNVPSKYSHALHIISYRYDVYKHTTAAIQAHSTAANVKPAIQQLAQILQYLDDVRNAYTSCARQGDTHLKGWFCPELEYHIWLDYIERSYHDGARTSMEKRVGVTFEYVQKRQKPEIFDFRKSFNNPTGKV